MDRIEVKSSPSLDKVDIQVDYSSEAPNTS